MRNKRVEWTKDWAGEDVHVVHLGSEVCVGEPLPLPVQEVGVQQLVVAVLGLADPGQALYRGLQVLKLGSGSVTL